MHGNRSGEQLAEELTALERPLWTNDPVVYEASLVEEALLVFPETGPITRGFAVDAIRQENAQGRRWGGVRFDEVRAVQLTSDAALLHYRATARWDGDADAIVVLASSVYVRRQGGWKLAFHQQSPPA